MFQKINRAFEKLLASPVAQAVSGSYDKIKSTMRKHIKVIQVLPRLYHIDYPYEEHAAFLRQHSGGEDFQLWNISQYSYEDNLEQILLSKDQRGQVYNLRFAFFANLPLFELIQAINQIEIFLKIKPQGKVYVHCQDNKLRSAVFLASYVFKTKVDNVSDIGEAILFVNSKLEISVEDQTSGIDENAYRAQHLLLKNIQNFSNNEQMINKKKLRLYKILINNTPKFRFQAGSAQSQSLQSQTKILLQIRTGEGLAHQSLHSNSIVEGETICFKLNKQQVILSDDFLVIVKFVRAKKAYSVLRSQLNTNFIFNQFVRVSQQDLDLSTYCEATTQHLFLDFLFEEQQDLSKLAKLKPEKEANDKRRQNDKKAKQIQSQELIKQQLKNQLNFTLQEGEEQKQLNQRQLSAKIQKVIQSMISKQEQNADSSDEEEEEDLQEYLSKLENQA